mgnify:CR=1 FL=1
MYFLTENASRARQREAQGLGQVNLPLGRIELEPDVDLVAGLGSGALAPRAPAPEQVVAAHPAE